MNYMVLYSDLFSGYGGFGYASRMWGLTLDNIIAMDVVIANDTMLHASEHDNANLFWVPTSFRSKYCLLSLTAANQLGHERSRWLIWNRNIDVFRNISYTEECDRLQLQLDLKRPKIRSDA